MPQSEKVKKTAVYDLLRGKRGEHMRRRTDLGAKNEVGAKIARLRKEKGWTQGDLLVKLDLMGVHLSARRISELEGQQREIRGIELKALAEIFDVTIKMRMRMIDGFRCGGSRLVLSGVPAN